MSQTERHKRLRLLLKRLNRQRKWQASRIDILCNDLICAQRAFLHQLQGIGFAAEFYHSLLGCTDLHDLLSRAGHLIRREAPEVGVSFYLRHLDGGDFRTVAPCPGGQWGPEELLPADVVDGICKSNVSGMLDDLPTTHLEQWPDELRTFSMATLPLSELGRPLGFVLLYRRLPETVTQEEVNRIGSVTSGLARAIRAARVPLPLSQR